MVQFQALGALTVTAGDRPRPIGGPRQRRLLAILLIHRNTVISRDRVAEAVFAGEPTPAAKTTLRSYVARLRRAVDDGHGAASRVTTMAPGYRLSVGDNELDLARFETHLADARGNLSRNDGPGAADAAGAALELWRGDPFAEFADEDWARPEAQRLAELHLVAHETFLEAEVACGRAAERIADLEAMVREHPTREAFQAQLMLALYRCGRHADALRSFQQHRRALAEELGLSPTPALEELEQRILGHDANLLLREVASAPLRGYRLGNRLGTGRDGTVFAAHLPGVERELAIRVIRPELADDPAFVRTFEARMQRLSSLRHPGIVSLHDYWREPGAAHVVMTRTHGGTLTDRLRRGTMSRFDLGALVERVGGALAAAAAAGISHGRISTDNVLLDDGGQPCLGDFPVAGSDHDPSPRDDVRAFARLVQQCLGSANGSVREVVDGAAARHLDPSMAELVESLQEALADTELERPSPPNPYKGLLAFDEVDAPRFFGRDTVVTDLLAHLGGQDPDSRLVLLVGGSGTGKSSVVRAGLLPRIRQGEIAGSDQWFVTTLVPGATPFDALAESLRRVSLVEPSGVATLVERDPAAFDGVLRRLVPEDGQLLLVVDQLEELFTSASERDQQAFLDALVHALATAGSRLRVVATLRADFFDRPLAVPGFASLVSEATVTIPAMTPTELEAAVVEPAERVGRQVERALVAELVSAVAHQPAALPSLQFILFELAADRATTLTLERYRQLGGVDGAIATRADQLYRSLDPSDQLAVRLLFEQVVVVDATDEPTRRRVPRQELTARDPSVDVVIDKWADARLLTLDRDPRSRVPTVEVAHEALLRRWPRLRGWVEEDRDTLLVLGRLREAAFEWDELDRDPGALYRGAQLEAVEQFADTRDLHLSEVEQAYLDASRSERDREARYVAEHTARQARANRRLRFQLGIIGVALAVALIAGVVAVNQRGEAEAESRVADARALAAAANASLADDPERGMLLALEAIDATRSRGRDPLPEAVEALHEATARSRLLASIPEVGGVLDWSPDGLTFAAEGDEGSGTVEVRNGASHEALRVLDTGGTDVNDVTYSADGALLATTGQSGLQVWDTATGEQREQFAFEGQGEVMGPSFSPDGRRIAASWIDQSAVRMFELGTGRQLWEHFAFSTGPTSFSPDGTQLVVAERERQPAARDILDDGRLVLEGTDIEIEPELLHATIYDATTGAVDVEVGPHRRYAHDDLSTPNAHFSPDGRWLVTAGGDGRLRLWDAHTGALGDVVDGHSGPVTAIDWTPDGTRLASVGDDGAALVTDVGERGFGASLRLAAEGTRSGLAGVAFSPDGTRLLTGDRQQSAVTVWDVGTSGGAEWLNVPSPTVGRGQRAVAFTADGRRLLVGLQRGRIAEWDLETGEQTAALIVEARGTGDLEQLALAPDGASIATSGPGGWVDLWDLDPTPRARTITTGVEPSLDWSDGGELLAVAADLDARYGQELVIVDRAGARQATMTETPWNSVGSVSFSPDARLVATTRRPNRDDPLRMGVRIWDWEQGETVQTIEAPALDAEFDPSGTRVTARLQGTGTVGIWEADTGEEVTTLEGPALVNDFAYGSDGSLLATAGGDGVVRLWDPTTSTEVLELRGHGTAVQAVTFSPDGDRLASVGIDGLVRVWALELEELEHLARERLTRTLTEDECLQYLGPDRCD